MTRIISRPAGINGGGARATLPRDWKGDVARAGELGTRAHAARILLDARRGARAILLDARETAYELIEAEREQARQIGYAEGQARARDELAAVTAPLAELVAATAVGYTESVRRLDEETLALSMAIARAVVKHEVALAPETVRAVARAALDELSLGASVTIRVNPADEGTLERGLPHLELPATIPLRLVADPAVAPGGCVVESGEGRVDATLETQLERVETLLREQLYGT